MKTLPTGNNTPQWDEKLLHDIAFIKKHMRYPVVRSRILPVVFWFVIIGLLVFSTYITFLFDKKAHSSHLPFLSMLLLCNLIIYITIITRYMQSLRFNSVLTPFYLGENIKALQYFLKEQHFLVFRHPEAPEVFQIISKNLGSRLKEDREVIIFIADDKRILINSHFTNQGWGIPAGNRHHKEMAKDMKVWIDQFSRTSNNSIAVR